MLKVVPCILKPVTSSTEAQTDISYDPDGYCQDSMPLQPNEMAIQTSDCGVQFCAMSFDQECQSGDVTTYDQSTMYEAPTTSTVYQDHGFYAPNDMSFNGYGDASTAATQTYVWSDEYEMEQQYENGQQNTGTQTIFEPLDEWYPRDANGRDFAGMTDPNFFDI
uniref:APPLE domain-containing protein n=3 Tax=Bursaphelenchus xylophilus TaxID=6326 RepID=A0A1I7SKE8_BURXY